MTIYFANANDGNDSNDGLDDLGLALTTASYDDTGGGSGEFQLTDGSAPFTSGMDGAVLALTGGAGITPGQYTVTYVSTTVVLLDRSAGSDSTGDVTTSDGPRLTIASAHGDADAATGNETRLVASATDFAPSAELTISTPVDAGARVPIIGCAAGGIVDGTHAVISMENMPTTGSGDLFGVGANSVNLLLRHLTVEGNSGGASVIDTSFLNTAVDLVDCIFDALLQPVIRIAGGSSTIRIDRCTIRDGAARGLNFLNTTTGTTSHVTITDSRIEGNATGGVAWIGSNRSATLVIERSVIAHNGTTTSHHGVELPGTSQQGNRVVVEGCTIDQNGGAGVSVGSAGCGQLHTRNSSITGNGTYGVALNGASDVTWQRDLHCCYYDNASGVSNGAPQYVLGRVTADPLYTDDTYPGTDYEPQDGSPLLEVATEAPA